jgi:hypothetical protein
LDSAAGTPAVAKFLQWIRGEAAELA